MAVPVPAATNRWEGARRRRLRLWVSAACLLLALPLLWQATHWYDWPLVNPPHGPLTGPLLCVGDSLVAGTGAETPDESYPGQLARLLTPLQVGAAGFPGDTAADSWRRVREHPRFAAAIVIVTTGGNDLLERRPWAATEPALDALFRELQERGALVVYTGVEPPFGWRLRWRQRALCRRRGVLFVPDILDGIFTDPALKADPIHPNGAGYAVMAERVASVLRRRGLVPEAPRPSLPPPQP